MEDTHFTFKYPYNSPDAKTYEATPNPLGIGMLVTVMPDRTLLPPGPWADELAELAETYSMMPMSLVKLLST